MLGKLSGADLPIIAKGALVTKAILAENGYDNIRKTHDIDMNWVGESLPTMDELVELVNNSLREVQDGLHTKVKREFLPNGLQAAGIRVYDKDVKIMSLDIDIRPVDGSRVYHYGDISFKGVLPQDIISDKMSVLSGDRILRRPKDFVDVYTLSHCLEIQTAEVFDICKKKNQPIGSFETFHTRKSELEHAYNVFKGLEYKPPFEEIYSYVDNFVRPFIEKSNSNQIWDCKNHAWSKKTYTFDMSENKQSEPPVASQQFKERIGSGVNLAVGDWIDSKVKDGKLDPAALPKIVDRAYRDFQNNTVWTRQDFSDGKHIEYRKGNDFDKPLQNGDYVIKFNEDANSYHLVEHLKDGKFVEIKNGSIEELQDLIKGRMLSEHVARAAHRVVELGRDVDNDLVKGQEPDMDYDNDFSVMD
ncbi:MAG: nucleotidyl transferase AbiEii/AbiGii toxin family protein [Chitinispirillales bacterium]|nr:nucleotidyl transferase AbiEii/AbiGii toxin family protein [Chitinispirillales bacterium]